jgi:hypothetical protein
MFGLREGAVAVAGAITVYLAILGFLLGWVLTRVFLRHILGMPIKISPTVMAWQHMLYRCSARRSRRAISPPSS